MQMFVLDENPYFSAQALADVHVRVICREISMCLSSWYYKNIGEHVEELPYRPFNHPVVDQFDNPYTRKWAMANADGIFNEFRNRFHKEHASEIKFDVLCDYIFRHDNELFGTFYYKYSPLKIEAYSTFSFVEKNKGVTTDVPIKDAVKLYRTYYKEKLKTMKVPVTYTNRNRPKWSK